MKKIIFAFAITVGLSCFAQNSCKCYKNNHDIVGDQVHTEKSGSSVLNYYAGVESGTVYFTEVQVSGDNARQIRIESMPVNKVSLKFNNMFASRSKTEDKKGYTLLTLGTVFSDQSKLVDILEDLCYLRHETLGTKKRKSLIMSVKFTDKAKLLKLTDKIKSLQK